MNDTDKPTQACADEDPELFFPISYADDSPSFLQVLDAKAVCAGCPFRSACLHIALKSGEQDGIWGGTTPDERRNLRRRAARQAAAAATV